jgi:hypothetical protein
MVMRVFKREATKTPQSTGSKLDRVSRMETKSLEEWFDTIIMSLGSSYDGWRYHGNPPEEVSESLYAMNEIWNEIQSRYS